MLPGGRVYRVGEGSRRVILLTRLLTLLSTGLTAPPKLALL